MTIDLLLLIICTFFATYSFYAWNKYSDRQSLYLGVLGIIVVFLIFSKLFLVNFFSENIKIILSTVIWILWIPVFIALIIIIFKKNKGLKEFSRGTPDLPQVASINTDFEKFEEKYKYPYYLGIQIEIKEKDSKGLPKGSEEIKNLDIFETDIDKKIKLVSSSYFVGRMTYNGLRYLYYYIDKNINIEELSKSINVEDNGRHCHVVIEKDNNWDLVKMYFNVSK